MGSIRSACVHKALAHGEKRQQKNRVDEVAPFLNPLLDSDESSYRASALHAIKKGWGSTVNEPFLKRILHDTKDAGVKKEVNAAIKRIGS